MKEKGFTLIELLAVIVILAIIALIATPVVLSIISNSKNKATLRSAEMYVGAVENSLGNLMLDEVNIEDGTYSIMKNGNLCLEINNNECSKGLLKIEIKGEAPSDGTVTLKDGQISEINFIYEGKTIVRNENGKIVYGEVKNETEVPKEKTLNDICTYDSTNVVAEKTAGAKYSCEVKDGTSYNFYVLTTPEENSDTINLIMERNICQDGTQTDANKTDKCLVAWYSSTNDNSYGPVTAMDFLYNATKDWENIPNIEMNYTDEGQTTSNGYGTIITENNITKITKRDGSPIAVLTDQEGYVDLKARMPYASEIRTYQENKANLYLYEFLESCSDCAEGYRNIQTNQIIGITGYWLLRSIMMIGPSNASYVYNYGGIFNSMVNTTKGVRPVITLKI